MGLPVEPLERLLLAQRTDQEELDRAGAPAVLARLTGFTRKSWHRWQADGIPPVFADQVAVSLGLHPVLIWSDWYEVSAAYDAFRSLVAWRGNQRRAERARAAKAFTMLHEWEGKAS